VGLSGSLGAQCFIFGALVPVQVRTNTHKHIVKHIVCPLGGKLGAVHSPPLSMRVWVTGTLVVLVTPWRLTLSSQGAFSLLFVCFLSARTSLDVRDHQ
jgi:hypothetical protein